MTGLPSPQIRGNLTGVTSFDPARDMAKTKRPISITVISGIFLLAGVVGLAYHGAELARAGRYQQGDFWVLFVRLLAVIGGAFLLRGANWARWLLVAWLMFHVALSALHSASEFIVHGLLLGVIAYFLFHRPASAYFRGAHSTPPPPDGESAVT